MEVQEWPAGVGLPAYSDSAEETDKLGYAALQKDFVGVYGFQFDL